MGVGQILELGIREGRAQWHGDERNLARLPVAEGRSESHWGTSVRGHAGTDR